MNNQGYTLTALLITFSLLTIVTGSYYFFMHPEIPSPDGVSSSPAAISTPPLQNPPLPINDTIKTPTPVTKAPVPPLSQQTATPKPVVEPPFTLQSALLNDVRTEEYYPIHGSTAAELKQQMEQAGMKDADGKPRYGWTSWDIDWHYTFWGQGAKCRPKTITVNVETKLRLPQWEEVASSTEESLRVSWTRFLNNLTLHENGHKEIALEAGGEILEALKNVSTPMSCSALSKMMNEKAQLIYDSVTGRNSFYDKETLNGRSQGVSFP